MRFHYISYHEHDWRNERNVADALAWHGYEVERYQVTEPRDRPGLNGAPRIKTGDVVFTSVPQSFDLAELKRYKDMGAKLVCWYWDWLWDLGNREADYIPRLQLMDVVFSTDGFDDAEYVKRGIICRHWLPQAAMPEDRVLVAPIGVPHHDIVFMGHLWTPERLEMARTLRDRFDFANYGNYTSPGGAVCHRIWGREMTDICQGAKIMIGSNFRNDIPGYWSDRCYVVMGAGGFYLGQYVPGIERYFKDGVHCGFYDSPADMVEKVGWWLKHDAERERCRKVGHALIHQRHTYVHRVGEMLDILRKMDIV